MSIKLENTDVYGWEAAIRGMRNPLNSWSKMDSEFSIENCVKEGRFKPSVEIGENDLKLMKTLAKAGDDHGKFLRMITVTVDINAPLYWWKEFDTYKVGTVANSCSTMHKIHAKEFTLDDFSHEHLGDLAINCLENTISVMNMWREYYIKDKTKFDWWQMIQLLPSSYNQKRTVQVNYAVLKAMYHARKNHKLDEWREFCAWCEGLPYFFELCIQ